MTSQKTVTIPRMFVSLWIGVVLAGGQTGCTLNKKTVAANTPATETRRAVAPGADGIARGLRNGDYYQIPKVPPPGARNTYSSVSVNGPYLAMTFDDGPHPQNTPRLLNMLKERNIKATFFVVGQLAKEYPDIIRRILADGHEIGNHTMTHPTITRLSEDKLQREIRGTHKALVDIAGYHTRLFRPPGGATNATLKQRFHDEFGYCTIMWSVDPQDWKRPGVGVVTSRLVNGAHNGGILLCHDLHAPTIDAMPNTLDTLLTKGYHFVTVSQLLNMETTNPAPVAAHNQTPSPTPAPVNAPAALPPVAPATIPTGQLPSPTGIPAEGVKLR
jgi:peptidoglycan/xylan/chitin deacetylase (PgdA/CDA1 family)